jgi:hypothetical protein
MHLYPNVLTSPDTPKQNTNGIIDNPLQPNAFLIPVLLPNPYAIAPHSFWVTRALVYALKRVYLSEEARYYPAISINPTSILLYRTCNALTTHIMAAHFSR